MIIDKTYFKGLLSVNKANATEQLNLDDNISKYEKKYLEMALGSELYDAFITGLAETTPDQKWIDLRDGATYSIIDNNGITRTIKWNGLINTEKQSFIAVVMKTALY